MHPSEMICDPLLVDGFACTVPTNKKSVDIF